MLQDNLIKNNLRTSIFKTALFIFLSVWLGFLVNVTALEFIDSNHRVVAIGCVRALFLFPILV